MAIFEFRFPIFGSSAYAKATADKATRVYG